MHTYRIELELRSGLGTPLSADTLWGHLCWGLRYQLGAPALEEWLARYDAGQPPLVLSDPLPSGYWPRPVLPPAPRAAQAPDKDAADRIKQQAKQAWLDDKRWQSCVNGLTPESVRLAATQSASAPQSVELNVTHAGINRLTGGTAQSDGGLLFNTPQNYYSQPQRFTVWSRSPEPLAIVRQWFEQGLAGGYGRDASAGLGQLSVVDATASEITAAKQPNAVMLLGPTIPKPGDPYRGWYQCGVRAGRVGGEFSISALPDGSTERQKRPVRCLGAGTILLCDHSPPPLWVGRLVRGVHHWADLRHYGVGFTVPVVVSQ